MNIRLHSVIPVGTTHRVYRDANRYAYVNGAEDWSYFLEFSHATDRIAYYRVLDRAGRLLGDGLDLAAAKKLIARQAANADQGGSQAA